MGHICANYAYMWMFILCSKYVHVMFIKCSTYVHVHRMFIDCIQFSRTTLCEYSELANTTKKRNHVRPGKTRCTHAPSKIKSKRMIRKKREKRKNDRKKCFSTLTKKH